MQEGIGRGGYRILALVFFGVGALGLVVAAVALQPDGLFDWLGLAFAAIAIATLTGLILATLGPTAFAPRAAAFAPGAEADGSPVPLPTPEPPVDADPDADLGFEYPDDGSGAGAPTPMAAPRAQPTLAPPYEPQPHVLPTQRTARSTPPRPMGRPAQHSAPPSGKSAHDESGWPQRRGPAGLTRRQVAEGGRGGSLPRDPGPEIEVDGPKPARREAPIIMARTVASAEATGIPDGTGVGKCGNCGVLLLAPKKRPIRLQCPRCERVHTLA